LAATEWFYARVGKDGTKVVQSVSVMAWEGSMATVVPEEKANGSAALNLGQPTLVTFDQLFRGRDNVPEDLTP
jgi:hypothetical protein